MENQMNSSVEQSRNIPALRFPEFNGEWEKKKLGELLEFKNGINASKEQYGKGVKFINVLDILYNEFITHDKIIGSVDVEKEIVEKYPVSYGDILFQRSSETREEVGTASVYLDREHTATFGGFVIRGRKIGEYEPVFLNKILKTDISRDSITSKSGGSTRYNVGQEILSSVELSFPTLPEQTKIATFLTAVDEKTQTLKKKKSLLEEYKKGVMQRLFCLNHGLNGLKDDTDYESVKSEQSIKIRDSDNLRFRQEDGSEFPDWEVKKGGDLFEPMSNKEHNSDLPILAISQELGAVPREMINYQISVTEKSIESYKVVEIGNFIISLRSFQGGIEYSNYKGICSPAYVILRNTVPIDKIFFKYYFKTDNYIQRLCEKLEGIRDGKMISYKYFSEIELPYPSIKEQTKNANFLSAIDEKINHTSTQIQQTEQWKKGLLQKMFV